MSGKDTIRREVAVRLACVFMTPEYLRGALICDKREGETAGDIAIRHAVTYADALLAELARTGKEEPPASEKPATRYDWAIIPQRYEWIATDEDGAVRAHEGTPIPYTAGDAYYLDDSGLGYWYSLDAFELSGRLSARTFSDWRDSLERRPT